MTSLGSDSGRIPEQVPTPWTVAFRVSWAGLRRRLGRSLITLLGVALAIALLTHMLLTDAITAALVAVNDPVLNLKLQKAGVDIFSEPGVDRMMALLIVLSLVTCLVGIMNSMLMSVTERIREIGTLKCLGALDAFILQSYFIESSLQGVAGTVLGILAGGVVAVAVAVGHYGGTVFRYFPLLRAVTSAGVALLTGTVLSVVASIAPAYWAARKDPVEAMRVEE